MLENNESSNDTTETDVSDPEASSPEITAEEVSEAYGESSEEPDGKTMEGMDEGKEALQTGDAPPGLENVESKEALRTEADDTSSGPETTEPEEPIHLDSRNQELAGMEHPETGVRYEHNTVVLEDGKQYDIVAPDFDSYFNASLEKEEYKESDYLQNKSCCAQLKEAVENDPEVAARFTPEQLEQIKNGDTPKGFTWHHDVFPGQKQLVESSIHAGTRHTGGRAIWGGGKANR